MTDEMYYERRAQLEKEYWVARSNRCHLVAKARIRKIAQLDFEQFGIPVEETKEKFNYYK